MPRQRPDAELACTRHSINLYNGDMEELRLIYPDVAPTVIIRKIVRKHLSDFKAKSTPKIKLEDVA